MSINIQNEQGGEMMSPPCILDLAFSLLFTLPKGGGQMYLCISDLKFSFFFYTSLNFNMVNRISDRVLDYFGINDSKKDKYLRSRLSSFLHNII